MDRELLRLIGLLLQKAEDEDYGDTDGVVSLDLGNAVIRLHLLSEQAAFDSYNLACEIVDHCLEEQWCSYPRATLELETGDGVYVYTYPEI